ncbi:MAG: sigma-54-dependent Fis family transcriptional regulator, partial [Thauera sp.]|nr:sigma-54-dependent Fis family transcriptional regulator [Thauera sp.]
VLEVALALLDEGETRILPVHLPEEVLQAVGDAPALAPSAGTERGEPRSARPADDPDPLPLPLRRARALDDDAIRAAIERFDGNLSAAARHLGVARNTLYRRMGRPF